jgi:hypothetical protein
MIRFSSFETKTQYALKTYTFRQVLHKQLICLFVIFFGFKSSSVFFPVVLFFLLTKNQQNLD